LLSTRGYRLGAVTFSYWPFSVGQVRDSHPAVQVRFQAHGARRLRRFDVQYQIRGLFDADASANACVEAA